MLDHLDELLRQLLSTRVPGLAANRIGFVPPDKDWRTAVATATTNALNVYLVELRENRNLRSNERFLQQSNGEYSQTLSPVRLDCIYLISAWSPISLNPLVESAVDEHVLLYDVAQALLASLPLDAAAIYAPGPLPGGFPDALLDPPPPAAVTPPEGFAKLPDFWMRMDSVWKPVVELIVTIPVVPVSRPLGPPVTTMTERFGPRSDGTVTALEVLITIGGVVRANGQPVSGAWVRLVELGTMLTTNTAGQFTFVGLVAGSYTLEAGSAGYAAHQRAITVPSDSGEYDISLT